MKTGIRFIAVLASIVGIVTNVAAEPEIDSNLPPLIVGYKNTVTIKSGSYSISKRNQNLAILGPGIYVAPTFFGSYTTYPRYALPIEISNSSRDVINISFERQTNRGFSFGGELLHLNNSYVISSISASQSKIKSAFLFAIVKKYFGEPGGFQPFVAGGAGGGSTDLNPDRTEHRKTASGAAAQVVAGIRYQNSHVSGYAEYRNVYAPSLSFPEGDHTGDIEGKLNLSGQGYFVGLGIHF